MYPFRSRRSRGPFVAFLGCALSGGVLVMLPSGGVSAVDGNSCAGLMAPGLFDHTTISSTRMVAADAAKKLPAYCEVTGTIAPESGSHIGVVYRLPAHWNGKMTGLGGGGFAGNITLEAAAPSLAEGYAVAQTDAGHPSPNGGDTSWILKAKGEFNKPQMVDFAYRAVHLMTTIGKDVVAKYYGRAEDKAYFIGCSTGGRQGLMEVTRFPADYDGVVAGAPVSNLQVYTNATLRTQFFHKDKASDLTAAQVNAAHDAALAACDAKDGLKDGIITDPRMCKWDPAELKCGKTAGGTCLTDKQVATVRNVYAGLSLGDGTVAADPLLRGGELNWLSRSIGTPKMPLGMDALLGAKVVSYIMMKDPNYDVMSFDPKTDMSKIENSEGAKLLLVTNADLSAFVKRGGKLLLWHGFNDPGPSPLETIKYYEAVTRTNAPKSGGPAGIGASVRLFLAPGVYHCGGGPGPSAFDQANVIDDWVTTGKPPERIVAAKADAPLKRPLCPYPALPYYDGHGDVDNPQSFVCRETPETSAP
jgi:feruloyl esterase